ncbi:HPr family phosphocarrier protein [Lipingzhangella sp. LS1_29]|uniref:HPr family phosphocarrier protein n=1 Tax=Lipingzhangella rawalii TaxID=2055835 RepID=A0ABU2H555_9ACTN|nr:HPr family phosphocarrier protein [Lipingzhangella rawalii]MDS1270428.1 HPr family phosphocarrier protein [Lipingzhangella rawalii]
MHRRVTVTSGAGLHARTAARLVEVATQAAEDVTVTKVSTGRSVSARSMLSVLTLDVHCGEEILLEVGSTDGAPLLDRLAAAVQEDG